MATPTSPHHVDVLTETRNDASEDASAVLASNVVTYSPAIASSAADIVAWTFAFSLAFNVCTVSSSKVTSQSGGVDALNSISVKSAVPVFSTTRSTFFFPPAVTSALSFPSGVDRDRSYLPVMTASNSNFSAFDPVDAWTGIL